MTLFDRLKTDNKRILGGDDMKPITLYNAVGASEAGKARGIDIDFAINPQGQPVNTGKLSIGFHIDDFPTITGTNETYISWEGQFLNSRGETIRGVFNNIFVDKTLNYVSTNLTLKKS